MATTRELSDKQDRIRASFLAQSALFEAAPAAAIEQGYDSLEDWFETRCRTFIAAKMPAPDRPGFMRDDTEWTLESLVAYADQLGRKLEPTDVTVGLRAFATTWLRSLPTPIDFEYLSEMRAVIAPGTGGKLTIPQAKGVLNCAVAAGRRKPRAPKVEGPEAPELEAAIYFKGGVVYKVQKAVHGSGHVYAKRLDPATKRFEYDKGAIRSLTAANRMTLEQAREFGAIYGVCCSCSATLTDEDSIEAGIGPICRRKFV